MKKRKVYAVRPSKAPVTHLLVRGSPFELGDEVSAGGVHAVTGSISSNFSLRPDAPDAERRNKLAAWISAPDNPLFARVIVNRLWHYHFGKGLVQTTNDLGFNGGTPSHPKLLDWLAAELKEQKWSLKAMHKIICDSATYRQSSQENPEALRKDSDNVLLWKRSISRLEAELIRDSILTVSGQLNKKMGGPGYRDFKMYITRVLGSMMQPILKALNLIAVAFTEHGQEVTFIHSSHHLTAQIHQRLPLSEVLQRLL